MNRTKFCIVLLFQVTLLFSQKNFSFVYLPDIHLQNDSAELATFNKVARQVNNLHPDFVLTGGDMIYTAKNVNDRKAEVLFDLMDKEFLLFSMPVYMTIGNHEHVGITGESGIDKTNPNWGKKMFEKRYGSQYYTFIYNGWKFFVLDGIEILEKERDYTQGIDSAQIRWIKSELKATGKSMPLVISIHTPVINPHALTSSGDMTISPEIENVMKLFKNHNLKLVLEGHTHLYMNLYFHGIYYVSGGSTAYGTDEADDGFVQVFIKNNNLKIKFNKISDVSKRPKRK
jgi:Icc protein